MASGNAEIGFPPLVRRRFLNIQHGSPCGCRNRRCSKIFSISSSKKSIGVIKNKRFIFSSKERLNKSRRQDRKPIYFECGTLYATRYDVLINKNSVKKESFMVRFNPQTILLFFLKSFCKLLRSSFFYFFIIFNKGRGLSKRVS